MFDSSLYTLVKSANILNVEAMLEDMSLTYSCKLEISSIDSIDGARGVGGF